MYEYKYTFIKMVLMKQRIALTSLSPCKQYSTASTEYGLVTYTYTNRVRNSIISFSMELIVFCDRKFDSIVEKCKSLPLIFLKIDGIDSLFFKD